jgi:8-oxo-dGTP pyrophosphatase MutT (NUDIX family)
MIKTASAGGIILNEYNEVVIVYANGRGWQFPKGTVEPGESHREAAAREIEEETGLTEITYCASLPPYLRVPRREKNIERTLYYFLYTAKKQELTPSREITECKWVTLDQAEATLTYPEDKLFFQKVRHDYALGK